MIDPQKVATLVDSVQKVERMAQAQLKALEAMGNALQFYAAGKTDGGAMARVTLRAFIVGSAVDSLERRVQQASEVHT